MPTSRLSPELRQFADNVESGARENAFDSVREEHRDWTRPRDEHPLFARYLLSTAEDILWGSRDDRHLMTDYGAPAMPREATKKKIIAGLRAKYQPKNLTQRDPQKTRRLTKPEKIALVMSLAQGDEVAIGGRIWFRIDANEFKVHRQGFQPDTRGSDTTWVPRRKTDVAGMI